MLRVAALDLGSNTFLLLIAEIEEGQITKVYADEIEMVRLAQGVHQFRRFHPEALRRAENCFRNYAEKIKLYHPDKVLVVATSAARDVENKEEFFSLAKNYGFNVSVISGKEEAELTYLGALSEGHQPPFVVIDIGGGSTELVGERGGELKSCSLDIGSVRLTEMFIKKHPVEERIQNQIKNYILDFFKKETIFDKKTSVISVAGTPVTLACIEKQIEYSPEELTNYKLTFSSIQKIRKKLAGMGIEERKKIKGLNPGRADVIVSGALILESFLEYMGVSETVVSLRGVRHGLALKA
ncbi:MAG: Ppx/GppA family phosphatase [Bdellovibrio sp.]|nr:MAG: Ppx/GppA family phosphatase [Bdellovibrio sp.]